MSLRLIELLRPSLANFSLVTSSSLSPATSTSHSRNAYVEIVRFLPANAFKTCVNQLLEKKDFASAASLLLFLSNFFPTNLEYWTQAISMLLPLTSSSMRARQLLVENFLKMNSILIDLLEIDRKQSFLTVSSLFLVEKIKHVTSINTVF